MANKLVVLATFDHSIKAELAKSALANAGIDAHLGDDNLVSMNWLLSNAVVGIKLIVREEDAERSLEIYREIETHLGTNSPIDDDELERQALEASSENGEFDESVEFNES